LVNSREHFESLIVAKETGYATIQSYLKSQSKRLDAGDTRVEIHLDKFSERVTRGLAGYSSRRGFLSRLGMALVAAPVIPLLPWRVPLRRNRPPNRFRASCAGQDPNKCDYWRYCAIDGVLCGCCGGGVHTCPRVPSPRRFSWIGTCVNPDDGRSYVIAYRDCCGKPVCQAGKECDCQSVDRELPTYRQQLITTSLVLRKRNGNLPLFDRRTGGFGRVSACCGRFCGCSLWPSSRPVPCRHAPRMVPSVFTQNCLMCHQAAASDWRGNFRGWPAASPRSAAGPRGAPI